ncbi:MAG: hypothetical protein A7315_01345 [Candidatus Altiarchaeales archaeon WOR_SM1_79]|nr:MAG: hypothetical protein A7315_01345 [Candidatus Altiarchaeales archaeon WOR_SM1_79]
MHLTTKEEKILDGEEGKAKQKSMQILAALGDIYNADKLIPVTSAHVSGVSYKTIGDAGLEFLDDFAKDAKVCVKTTLNPCGMDLKNWKKQKIPVNFAKKQLKIIDCFKRMGVEESYTCVPYLTTNRPEFGEHISWAESSAVCFANSMLGARTNRESGISALASAIIGKTPNYGLHLDENRIAKVEVRVDDQAKALSAALGVGSCGMFQIEGVTPENAADIESRISINDGDFNDYLKNFTFNKNKKKELIAVGCPHCSLNEIEEIAGLLKDKKVKKDFWICTSRQIKKLADERGFTEIVEKSGGKILCDTCMVVTPVEEIAERVIVNSAKAAYYLPGLAGVEAGFTDLDEMV